MKRKKKPFILFLLIALTAIVYVYPVSADNDELTAKQAKVHEIAETARELGLAEDDPIIRRASELWHIYEEAKEKEPSVTYLGEFTCYAYCPCAACCGKGASGITATGTQARAGRTIAVDPKVIPLGSRVVINGHTYIAEDTGGAIKGNKIDIFTGSHREARTFGVQRLEVYLVR